MDPPLLSVPVRDARETTWTSSLGDERWNLGRDKGALRSGNWDETRNKGIEPVLGPRGAPNQDERIGYESSLAQYDRSAASLQNHKNGGRRYGATGPSYIPAIA